MGRSIRSKRALMLRAAKASSLNELTTARLQQLNNKLKQTIDIQNHVIDIPDNIPEQITVTDIDTQYKISNFIDLRANKTMSFNESAVVHGIRVPQQYHIHPTADKLREQLKPVKYKPKQFSYYISPTESIIKSNTIQSNNQLQYTSARLDDHTREIVENEDKDENQHIKIRNIKKRVRDSDAMELDNALGMKLGNTQYINKYGGKLDGNILPDRKKQKIKLSSKQKRIQKSSNKKDLFKQLGKYSGRGKM